MPFGLNISRMAYFSLRTKKESIRFTAVHGS